MKNINSRSKQKTHDLSHLRFSYSSCVLLSSLTISAFISVPTHPILAASNNFQTSSYSIYFRILNLLSGTNPFLQICLVLNELSKRLVVDRRNWSRTVSSLYSNNNGLFLLGSRRHHENKSDDTCVSCKDKSRNCSGKEKTRLENCYGFVSNSIQPRRWKKFHTKPYSIYSKTTLY